MYIKYLNQVDELKIETLDLTVSETVTNDTKERLFSLTNCNIGRKIDEIFTFSIREVLELLERNGHLDMGRFESIITGYADDKRYDYSVSYITICGQEALTVAQFEKFIELLENAIQSNAKLFDVTAIAVDDIGQPN